MSATGHIRRSAIAAAAAALLSQSSMSASVAGTVHHSSPGTPTVVQEQHVSVQTLLERGALDEAVQRAENERDNPESTYLAAQAFAKMEDGDRAGQQFARLQETGDDSWKAIGESATLAISGNTGGAMDAANRAIAANGDNAYAHYQLGLIASRQNNFQRALAAFERAIELKPDFAYAHYYAGLASQRIRQTAKMSMHL
ncbi:MAG: tetratricopeptide repeat protein [Acidobacteria bacterium]|nr:tetratricopeptide repeat protein [Acidobacteriota bacterium]